MNLPFYFTTTVKTDLPAREIINILDRYTLTNGGSTFKDKRATVFNKQQFSQSQKNYLYKASVFGTKFKMTRLISSNSGRSGNAFNPFCFGSVRELVNGSEISLRFRPVIIVMIFMFIFSFGMAEAFAGIIIESLTQGKYKDAAITPIAFMPIFAVWWFFYRYGFKREVYRTLSFFKMIGISK